MLPTERLNVSLIFHFSEALLSILGSTASGHCMYSQWSLYVQPVVNVCTASGHCMYSQWSLYVQPSGQCMYRQWSMYVQPVVTMYSQWSLYVQLVVTMYSVQRLLYLNITVSLFIPVSASVQTSPLDFRY